MTGSRLPTTCAKSDSDWLSFVLDALRYYGCVVVTDVLTSELQQRTRLAMYETQARIVGDLGQERLDRAGELGVLRLACLYDQLFLDLLTLPEMLAVVDSVVSETAILHLQNGFILPSRLASTSESFQHTFHRDFPRMLNGYVASVNAMLTLDDFTVSNGGTLVACGTHQRVERPDDAYLEAVALPIECSAGAMIVFDSTLWHAAGQNRSGQDRLAINHMFTRSFIKQQIDYARALGDETVLAQPPRVQQLLGWYTRVVTSLDEYYRPSEERLYRAGQG
jgi:ectoine hydroxylase-related dioxygenase (phytanoyl-CoA dioxygenase family)